MEPRIKMKSSFLTHVTYIMQKWHFTAILFAFIYNATFCTLMITKLLWTSEGKIEPDEKREIIRDGFKEALLELFKNKNYDAKTLFNNKSVKWFRKLFTSNEIKEIKEDILQVVDNANLTIERFPDY
jgi:hypothetical protein